MTKICSKCKIEKSIKDFYKRKTSKDGLRCHCKKCDDQYRDQWRINNYSWQRNKKMNDPEYHTLLELTTTMGRG
jgi:hypothetical protein